MVDTAPNKHSLPSGANRVYEWQWGTVLDKNDIPVVLEQAAVLIHNMRKMLSGADTGSVSNPIPISGFCVVVDLCKHCADTKPAIEVQEPPQAFKFDEVFVLLK